jgi:hypothetical protein
MVYKAKPNNNSLNFYMQGYNLLDTSTCLKLDKCFMIKTTTKQEMVIITNVCACVINVSYYLL